MSDGRVSEFKGATVVIPEGPADEAEAAVYWVAINGKGEMFADEKGDPVIVEAPGLILGRLPPDPESYVSLRDIADLSGLSESTIERAVDRGDLVDGQRARCRDQRDQAEDREPPCGRELQWAATGGDGGVSQRASGAEAAAA